MFRSRKFSIAVLMLLIATGLLACGLLTQAVWLQVAQLVGGGYFVANVGQKAVEQIAAAVQSKLAAPPKATP